MNVWLRPLRVGAKESKIPHLYAPPQGEAYECLRFLRALRF